MASSRVAIGIDLGTTYSCVGVYRNNGVKIIYNDVGNLTTPSYVSFTHDERYVGDSAKDLIASNPENTVFDAKRLIGRKFNEPKVQEDIVHWPFTVTDDGNNNPVIEVEYKNEEKRFTPQEISSMVLSKMKAIAETYLRSEVTDAVITVPAYFNNRQRQATKEAGEIAGLNVLRIINEPTSAAIAYGLNKSSSAKKNALIFDLGGGTFDVVVLSIEDSILDVMAVGGDTHLGGQDIDNILVDHFLKEIRQKHGNEVSLNNRALQRLRIACEKAKRSLTSSISAHVFVDCLIGQTDFRSKITRERFEQLCSDLFLKTLDSVKKTLQDAEMDKSEIDEIVLVGGSTRILKVQALLRDFFGGKTLNMSINPDEAVAYGAAAQAAIMTGMIPLKKVVLQDVTPLSLGIETVEGRMNTIIRRNTKIPVKSIKRDFTTARDNQDNMEIQVYQGENSETEFNHLLGSFTLTDIQKAPCGVPSIDITFEMNNDGILHVSAVDRATKCQGRVDIAGVTGRLSQEDMSRMVDERKTFDLDDQRRRQTILATEKLESFCDTTSRKVESGGIAGEKITDDERKIVIDACNRGHEWMDTNERATKEQVEAELEAVKQICTPILVKL